MGGNSCEGMVYSLGTLFPPHGSCGMTVRKLSSRYLLNSSHVQDTVSIYKGHKVKVICQEGGRDSLYNHKKS